MFEDTCSVPVWPDPILESIPKTAQHLLSLHEVDNQLRCAVPSQDLAGCLHVLRMC